MRRRRASTLSQIQSATSNASHPDLPLAETDSGSDADFEHRSKSAIALGPIRIPTSFHQLSLVLLSYLNQLYFDFVVMALGLTRWWNGTTDNDQQDGSGSGVEMRVHPGEKKKVKRRRRKIDHTQDGASSGDNDEPRYYPGMVNLSGTLCYMNSVLQAFASIPSLVRHLEHIVALALEVDLPTPVTDTLLNVLNELNTPHRRSPPALRPHNLLAALQPLPAIRRLLSTREQQDAHELFIVLAEAVSDEAMKVASEVAKSQGLGEVLSLQGYVVGKNHTGVGGGGLRNDLVGLKKRNRIRGIAQPWEGLMARRRVCKKCSWSEAIRMDTLGGMELPVPLHGDTSLDACIADYLSPENLSDVTCEMCSLRQTLSHYQAEVERLSAPAGEVFRKSKLQSEIAVVASGSFSSLDGEPAEPLTKADAASVSMTNSRKKRAKDAKRVENRLQEMISSSSITGFGEQFLQPTKTHSAPLPIKWQVCKTNSLREGMITRSPQSLRLHLIRSEYTMYGNVVKKTARIHFPMILDMTRFVARGVWEQRSDTNGLLAAQSQSQSQTQVENEMEMGKTKRVLYRLESAILHYGYTHSSGHFVCLRRKPRPRETPYVLEDGSTSDSYTPLKVEKSCQDGCRCENCLYFGQVRNTNGEGNGNESMGRGWLRISDADVEEVGEEALYEARGAVFMLFYEKVGEPTQAPSRIEGEQHRTTEDEAGQDAEEQRVVT